MSPCRRLCNPGPPGIEAWAADLTATAGSTSAGAESAAEESSTPKAHTTANESIAAGVEAAAEEESTTTDAEPAEAAT
jgi:hypothetical protein